MELDADSIQSLKYMIRVTPAGEMKDVLIHMKTLLDGEDTLINNPEIIGAMKKWYETHRQHINLPGGKIALVTAAGDASAAGDSNLTYYDGILELTFSFNAFTYPFTLEGTIVSDEAMQVPTSDLKTSLIAEVSNYLKSSFSDKKALYAVN